MDLLKKAEKLMIEVKAFKKTVKEAKQILILEAYKQNVITLDEAVEKIS